MNPTEHPLPAEVREAVTAPLRRGVILSIDLGLQSKQAHWTLRGPTFIALHELFDDIAEAAGEYADLCAERLMALGGVADGTSATVAAQSPLRPYPIGLMAAERHIDLLASALGSYARFNYEAIKSTADAGDPTTSDVFTEISRGIDQLLWKVEAHRLPGA